MVKQIIGQAAGQIKKYTILLVLITVFGSFFFGVGPTLGVQAAPISVPDKPTMTDYWNGTAEFKLYNEMKANNKADWQRAPNPALDNGYQLGSKIIADGGGGWYWIGKSIGASCPGRSELTTKLTIRQSNSRGQFWSAPIDPMPQNPSNDCQSANGSMYWDDANNRWVMIYQCLGSATSFKWKGCIAFRSGVSPMGAFEPVANPIFNGNSVGNWLCATNYDCGNGGFHPFGIGLNYYVDETNFDIIGKVGSDFVISASLVITGSGNRRGDTLRVMLKSQDWLNWRIGDNNQTFPILDKSLQPAMLENWTDGAKGFVGADSIEESGYIYQTSEAVSKSANCQSGQKWNTALQRIATTGIVGNSNWEMYAQNPIAYSSDQLLPSTGLTAPCSPSSGGLFKDNTQTTYYYQSRVDEVNNGVEVYQLQRKRNILENGSFLRGQQDNWSFSGVTGSISRNHLDSSDNNFALKMVVNNPGLNGGVYTVNEKSLSVPELNKTYQQSIKIKSNMPMSGLMRLVQVDAAENWLTYSNKNFNSNSNYQDILQNDITLLPNTTKILSVVYPIGSGTMYVDEASLEESTPKIANSACSNPISIMAIGDSNTEGLGSAQNNGTFITSYRLPFYSRMKLTGYNIDMVGSKDTLYDGARLPAGMDGDHQARGANTSFDLRTIIANDQAVKRTKPDFAIMMIGTNDVLRLSTNLEGSLDGLKKLLTEVNKQSPTTKIILSKIPPLISGANDWSGTIPLVEAYNNALNSYIPQLIAQGLPITLIEQGATLKSDMLNDGLHPNPVGESKIASKFYEALALTPLFQDYKTNCPSNFQAPGTLKVKVNLQGAYNTTANAMRTDLRNKNLISSDNPFDDTMISGSINTTGAVDWVQVIVQDTQNPSIIPLDQGGLLLSDGSIIMDPSKSGASNNTRILAPSKYKVTIKHRNHLAITTNTDIDIIQGQTTTLDFTTNQNVKGSNQAILKPGVFGLKMGNTNGNSLINSQDRVLLRSSNDRVNIYSPLDVNLDGNISSIDRVMSRSVADSLEQL